jgi:hypothetical protein
MVYIIIDEDRKVRKFKSIKRMERYMKRKDGIYFVIDVLRDFLAVVVIKSENGELNIIKGLRIERYR